MGGRSGARIRRRTGGSGAGGGTLLHRWARRIRGLKRKPSPPADLCILVDAGVPCTRPRVNRGLCYAHDAFLRKAGRLEDFALPSKYRPVDSLDVVGKPRKGICRVAEGGVPCGARATSRGLCARHYAWVQRHPERDVEGLLRPNPRPRFKLKRTLPAGICRLRDGGVDCEEVAHRRGLCLRHYRVLEARPDVLERLALREKKAVRYTLRARVRAGLCRVAEDGAGCPEPAHLRGLCARHYDRMRREPQAFEGIALASRTRKRPQLTRVLDPEVDLTRCAVLEDGIRCTEPPFRRGICRTHHRRIGASRTLSVFDFYVEPTLTLKPFSALRPGRCRVVENGVGCSSNVARRGLCHRHYRVARKAGRLDAVALPFKTHERWGPGNRLPHLYLDRNILLDYANRSLFGPGPETASVLLVDRVCAAEAHGSILLDGLKAVYEHVRLGVLAPKSKGGGGGSAREAVHAARTHVRSTYLEGGAWRFLVLDAESLARAVAGDDPESDLDVALELEAWRQARSGDAIPMWFVTRNRTIAEGRSPAEVVQELGWL